MSSPDDPLVRGLFQRRIAGDEALLGLAALRFRQAGMGVELYAETPQQLERLLRFAPPTSALPTVHLDRRIDVLTAGGRASIAGFQRRFAGRIAGVIIHDRANMAGRLEATAAALQDLGTAPASSGLPTVFLESAGGLDVERFVRVAELIKNVELASVCLDVGHVGIRHAREEITRRLGSAGVPGTYDPDLVSVIEPVAESVASALSVVVSMIDALGEIDKPVHFHLHDGHPLTSGLSDHRSFLTRVPIPFPFRGSSSLPQLYGPGGLASILAHARRMKAQPSYTLEIHQVEGRLPLLDAQPMFAHWTDLTNAERMNYWLGVLAENQLLTRDLLRESSIDDHETVLERS